MRKHCDFLNSFNVLTTCLARTSSLRLLMRCAFNVACVFVVVATAEAQIQVDLKFKRLQYIAYEPVVATLSITNMAGRDVDLHDSDGQSWLGFEITGNEG